MDTKKLPISNVLPFADRAAELGCYSKTRRYNLGTAWAVLTEGLGTVGLNVSSTVEQLQPKIADILSERGRKSKVSANSLRAYQSRIKKLLDDFAKWNGGDFMKWKEEIDKPPGNDDPKSPKRRKSPRQPNNSGDDMDSITHRLIAGEGKEGRIVLPTDLTEQEIESIWAQLTALQNLIKAQAAALNAKPARAV